MELTSMQALAIGVGYVAVGLAAVGSAIGAGYQVFIKSTGGVGISYFY